MMDEEEKHSPREISIILNIWKLLMQKMKKASPKARRPKTILSTNRKVQTQTGRLLLIWTLFSATSKLMVWKMRKLKAYLRPSLTTFCRNLFERTEAKRRRIRAGDSFQFSAQHKLTAILRRNTHLTSQGQWVRKIRKVLPAKRKSLVLTWARQRKQTESCSGHRRRRRGCPFFFNFEFGDPSPVAPQRTVW